jgi:WD40 repeat protein
MHIRGEHLLLAFLAFGVSLFLLTILLGKGSSADPNGDAYTEDKSASVAQVMPDAAHNVHGIISLEGYNLNTETATRWKLPDRLREISGLAMTPDNRLLAHNDEKGIVYEIDYRNGSIVKSFALTDKIAPVSDDFEGIAAVDDRIFLVTSSGRVYECNEGKDGQKVLFDVYTTGIGRDCEIESLAYEPRQRALLLMCKKPRSADQKGFLTLFKWSIDTKRLVEDGHIVLPITGFSDRINSKSFHPSGIERHPVSGNYFIVAARESAIAEITPRGEVIAVMKFPAQSHRQAEGITFSTQQTLIVSDEGSGKRARLTIYPISGNQQSSEI